MSGMGGGCRGGGSEIGDEQSTLPKRGRREGSEDGRAGARRCRGEAAEAMVGEGRGGGGGGGGGGGVAMRRRERERWRFTGEGETQRLIPCERENEWAIAS